MSRGKGLFTQGDVTKAVKATVKAGVAIERVEIGRDGKIVIVVATPATKAKDGKNEWDEVLDGPTSPPIC
jgi:hypothetical protein